jgi:hypothetical protein
MSDLRPLSGEERKSNFGAVRSVDDPKLTSGCSAHGIFGLTQVLALYFLARLW